MSQVEIREIDDQGRIIIPKAWRDKHLKNKKIIMKLKEDAVEIIPYRSPDLTKFFDKMEADVKSDLSNWHSVQRELRKR